MSKLAITSQYGDYSYNVIDERKRIHAKHMDKLKKVQSVLDLRRDSNQVIRSNQIKSTRKINKTYVRHCREAEIQQEN